MGRTLFLRSVTASLLALGAVCLPASAAVAQTPEAGGRQYELRDLGDFGGLYVRANGVGPANAVVGQAEVVRYQSRVTGWTNSPAGALSFFDRDAPFRNRALVPLDAFAQWFGMGPVVAPRNMQDPANPDYDGWGRRVGNYLEITRTVREQPFIFVGGRLRTLNFPGGGVATATAVNGAGQYVGAAVFREIQADSVAFLFNPSGRGRGEVIRLGTFGGRHSAAYDINERGQVVGDAEQMGGVWRAFRWQNGKLSDLGTLGGSQSYARAVNERGQVVGWAEDGMYRTRPVRWESDGTPRALDLPRDAVAAYAVGLNDAGVAVGRAVREDGAAYPVLWDDEGRVRRLDPTGRLLGEARGVNSQGEVVGDLLDARGESRPFLWRSGKLYDLNRYVPARSGWTLRRANSINDSGAVAGFGLRKNKTRAFLMTPAPPNRGRR
jgi:probable HAF family extracellular repeat protein